MSLVRLGSIIAPAGEIKTNSEVKIIFFSVYFVYIRKFLGDMADSSKPDADKEAAEREGQDVVPTTVLRIPPPTRSRIYPATSINIKRDYWKSEHAEQTFLDALYSRLQAKSLLFAGSTITAKFVLFYLHLVIYMLLKGNTG